ncbi:unnamed protein product, partial [Urochloa humidicola]
LPSRHAREAAGRREVDGLRHGARHHRDGDPLPYDVHTLRRLLAGEMSLKAYVAGATMFLFSAKAGQIYLEQKYELKTKKMEVDLLKEQLRERDQEITSLEAAWLSMENQRVAGDRLGPLKAVKAR